MGLLKHGDTTNSVAGILGQNITLSEIKTYDTEKAVFALSNTLGYYNGEPPFPEMG